ncbi:hypothetical protein K438DRAFT_904425 [Mycena galopus ATCC 62051]|nr:hypothetical protein K438DRAFT_904425 [Mycena galopus ATCC 62051]
MRGHQLTMAEENERLRAENTEQKKILAAQEAQLSTLNHLSIFLPTHSSESIYITTKTEKLSSQTRKAKLIPRPKGQAGQRGGYVLQDEMRLEDDPLRFRRLLRIVRAYANWYLPTGKTILKQDKVKLDELIQLIQSNVKYFACFHGGWPIHAIIKQYLRNAGNKLRRDLALESDADKDSPKGALSSRARVRSKGGKPADGSDASDDEEDTNGLWIDDEEEDDADAEADNFNNDQPGDEDVLVDDVFAKDNNGESGDDLLLHTADWEREDGSARKTRAEAMGRSTNQLDKENFVPSEHPEGDTVVEKTSIPQKGYSGFSSVSCF